MHHCSATNRQKMSNVTAPLLLPAYASAGAYEWASSALEGMRAGAQLITQSLTDFLPHDPGNMGGCASTSQQHQQSRVDDEGYIVTDWKLHTTQHHDSRATPVDSAHIITRNPAGVAFSQSPRDGAHLLSSWRGDGTPAGHREKEQQEEPIPLQVDPTALVPGDYMPELSEESGLLTDEDVRALAMAVPIRHRWAHWRLLYATMRDGISLQTLYRRAAEAGPAVLIVRDTSGRVFGAFTSEPWRIAPRYYGTGESFVFQLRPRPTLWPWHQRLMARQRNDYFQFGRPDCLALGGAPRYALCLDGDLNCGSSGPSDTFGSPCLAGSEEFTVGRLELWGLV